ncbi:uncharacterized protein TRIADDRAFT_59801 [Trichoplax adhaerens]|uniref:Uncharacterized protein n=1 Tax=Trichoplax adhaerens TaxID=10228 RepID=B3S6H0_TRIAD|nr:hypothetical protein TRIADDRAFT_59801 [Trichoplax adhaerens]EDV21758.1 hypothetical protein TRIADDRAFT_59801 [Trichoplax adhaerens]|eukprot:XP_002115906.1 hypothetical protein TRIADDRAFT_59801 [Trichoplax adhaerens]
MPSLQNKTTANSTDTSEKNLKDEKKVVQEEEECEEDEEGDEDEEAETEDSDDQVDEEANERRKDECLQDMSVLEKKFIEIKDRFFQERLNELNQKAEEIKNETAEEYIASRAEIEDHCKKRNSVSELIRDCKAQIITTIFEAEKIASQQHFESEKRALLESMCAEYEEKVRKLEEDRNCVDLSSELWYKSSDNTSMKGSRKRDSTDGLLYPQKRKKPVTVSDILIHFYALSCCYLPNSLTIYENITVISKQGESLPEEDLIVSFL